MVFGSCPIPTRRTECPFSAEVTAWTLHTNTHSWQHSFFSPIHQHPVIFSCHVKVKCNQEKKYEAHISKGPDSTRNLVGIFFRSRLLCDNMLCRKNLTFILILYVWLLICSFVITFQPAVKVLRSSTFSLHHLNKLYNSGDD